MKQPDINKLAKHYAAILEEIGADLNSEGMRETPLRAAKALVEMTEGSRMDTDQLTKLFQAECVQAVCHDMVIVEEKIVQPLGVAVLIDGKHMCAMARGVRDMHSNIKVNVMHGVFQKDPNIRAELLARVTQR